MDLVYRITERAPELVRLTEDGTLQRTFENSGDPPSPTTPPLWFVDVIRIRRNMADPFTTDFLYTDVLPVTGIPDTAWTTGNGRYYYYTGTGWKPYSLKFSDHYLRDLVEQRGVLKASIQCIDDLLARNDPADRIISGNTGAQSLSFPSPTELREYYKDRKKALEAEIAAQSGMNSGRFLSVKRKPVGGVWEA